LRETDFAAVGPVGSVYISVELTTTRLEPETASELSEAALRFARRLHLGQYRKQTYEQYVEHPIAVARLLADRGCDDRLLVAAYLHDIVEKTRIEIDEIRSRFGSEVADVVDALSDDPAISDYAERKRELRRAVIAAGDSAARIFAADRLANMRDWRTLAPRDRDACAARLGTELTERLQLWSEDLEALGEHDPELPFLAEIEIELRALRAEADALATNGSA
jgi:(p)ppGpp synthase/HD superfamily hydrolase